MRSCVARPRAVVLAQTRAQTGGMSTASRDSCNGARYEPGTMRGHYESWFLRANDASGRRAFWIRYTIFSPRGRPGDAVGVLLAG